jgi:hypothetical protein
MINRASSGWMRRLLLGFAVLLGLGTVAALSVQGLHNAWQNIGGHETLIQRAMTAFQITYALLGPLAVWLVWQRHPLALRAALAWAVALVGCGGMWCLAQLRRTP